MYLADPGRPVGPVEAALLRELEPTFAVRAVPAGGTTFRVLAGGSGPAVVLIHGRGQAATSWAPWLLHLARGHRVIAFDLPGFGATPAGQVRPGGAEEGLDYFVDPVAALLAVLQVEAPIVVGHSLGAFVALELALRRVIAPRALVLIGAMGVGPAMSYASRAFFLAPPERLARSLGEKLFTRIAPLPAHAWSRRMETLAHELGAVPGGRPVPTAAFNRLFPLVGPAHHRLDRLGEIEAPTLVVWGDHDPVFPAPAALVAAAALPRGRAVLHKLGHAPHLEDPDTVLADVERFLASLP